MKNNFKQIKRNILAASFVLFSLASCRQYDKQGELLYKFHRNNNGPTIQEGDMAALSFIEKTEEGLILNNTYDKDDRPVINVRVRSLFKGDFNTALGLLSEGDSATFKISLDSLVTREAISRPDTKGKYMVYTIKVDKVVPRGNLSDSLYTVKFEELRKELAEKEKSRESVKIQKYITSKKLKPSVTASGLYYIITQKGAGPVANPGDTVFANYTGMYLSEKPYLTTYQETARLAKLTPYNMLTTQVGKGKSLAGLEEAFMMFPQGTKVKLIIPSKLAYQAYYHQGIEPYTPLVFELEIMKVIKAG